MPTINISIPTETEIGGLLAEAINNAARLYLDTFLAKVPSYTGASRGQLAPLAADAGVSLSERGQISAQTGIDIKNHRATFTVAYPLDYFQVNETTDASKWGLNLENPGPYNALPAAEAAAQEVLERAGSAVLENIVAAFRAGFGGK